MLKTCKTHCWISPAGIDMRKIGLIIIGLCCFNFVWAIDRLDIPLMRSVVCLMPQDNPTGSTPDPTDPNQFRASLTGNTLLIETQKETVSYVVIRSDFSDDADEDYFFAISIDSVSCPIDRPGKYTIRIGHWNTDFVGFLEVKELNWFDFNGKNYGMDKPAWQTGMYYILILQTNLGNSSVKYLAQ